MERYFRNRLAYTLFLAPALLLFLMTVFVPIVWSLGYSFFEWDSVTPPIFVGIKNYARMLRDGVLWIAVSNNLIFMLINLGAQTVGALAIALLLVKAPVGREVFKVLYFSPQILSTAAVALVFRNFYSREPQGLFNALLEAMKLGHWQQAWLSNPNIVLFLVSMTTAYRSIGLYMLIFYAALIAVPGDLIEYADLEGASGWQQLWRIRIPLIKDVIAVVMVMIANGTLKAFDIPYLLTNGGPGRLTEMVSTYMYKTAFSSLSYGYGSAIAVFLVVECICIITIIRKALSFTKGADDS